MKNKGWIAVIVLLIPSIIWVILDFSLVNSRKLNYYGPKKLAKNGKDTIYYSLGNVEFYDRHLKKFTVDTHSYKVFLTVFIKPEYIKEKFRIGQFIAMAHYEPDKIKHIPVFLVYPYSSSDTLFNLKDSLHIALSNVQQVFLPDSAFRHTLLRFFVQRPYYVDYSFAVLVDKNRNIRGYYDWRYADEVKRTIQEFNHLIIKEGYKETLRKNKIEKR